MTYTLFVKLLKIRGTIEHKTDSIYFNAVLLPSQTEFVYSWNDSNIKIGTTQLITHKCSHPPVINSTLEYIIQTIQDEPTYTITDNDY